MSKKLTTQEKLDLISEYRIQQDLLQADRLRLIDEATPPEVKAAIAVINEEFAGKDEAVTANIAALEAEVKAEVLQAGQTIKGKNLQAVFMKGRVNWDAKNLDGFAVTHPEILFARSEGTPSVSIRAGKG